MTLRKNVGSQKVPFALVNATDGSALTGATCTVKLTLNGASQTTAGGSVTELAGGQYVYAPTQGDTNADSLGILITATNAIPVSFTVFPTAADPTDGVRLGLTALPNVSAGASGGLPTGDASGRVDVGAIGGTTQTARDLGASVLLSSGTGSGQIDLSSGKVLLQATQTGVTIPTVTTLTNAPSDSSGTTTLLSRLGSALSISGGKVTVGTNDDKAGYTLTAPYDAAKTAAQAGDAMALTSGERTTLAGVVWATLSSGLSTVGSIGKRVVDYLDATVSSRASQTTVDDLPTNTELATALSGADDAVLAAISALNNLSSEGAQDAAEAALVAYGAAVGADIPTTAEIADRILGRSLSGGADGGRTVKDSLRPGRNKVVIDGNSITVYAEDDTTIAWSGTVTRAQLNALQTIDPA